MSSTVHRLNLLLLLISGCCCPEVCYSQTASEPVARSSETARGIVFDDANGDGDFDRGERPLSNIRVSNGREIVTTDEQGRYRLHVDDDDVVFLIKPKGWRTPLSNDNLPRFYYIHKPAGSPDLEFAGVQPTGPLPDSIDFPLYPQEEPDQFQAILFGDPQPRDQREVDFIAHDVVEQLIGTSASFGVTLGDITFDDLSLFEPQARIIALLGIPWYNVIGNHDINYDAKHDAHSDETFERVFGPSYYSFDYGPVHFLVLDDVEWLVEENGEGRYRGGLGKDQMDFIRRDLSLIPNGQLVVLMMHIPLVDVRDRHELYRLIETRPFCISISAHEHIHQHRFITKDDGWQGPQPHHHIINVTVSGSWWQGAPDERGIPHTLMADGAPNGYSIISFDGHEYKLAFRAAGRSEEYQMQIYAPEAVSIGELPDTMIYANVFNGSERSDVRMRIGEDGDWTAMARTLEVDPGYRRTYDLEAALKDKPWRDLPDPAESTHLWKVALPNDLKPGAFLIHVQSTDMHGQTHDAYRVVRIISEDR